MIEENQGLSGRLGSDEPTALSSASPIEPAAQSRPSGLQSADAARHGPPGTFHMVADRFAKVRAAYPAAAIIRPGAPGHYTIFGTVYDAMPLEVRL